MMHKGSDSRTAEATSRRATLQSVAEVSLGAGASLIAGLLSIVFKAAEDKGWTAAFYEIARHEWVILLAVAVPLLTSALTTVLVFRRFRKQRRLKAEVTGAYIRALGASSLDPDRGARTLA